MYQSPETGPGGISVALTMQTIRQIAVVKQVVFTFIFTSIKMNDLLMQYKVRIAIISHNQYEPVYYWVQKRHNRIHHSS